MRAALIAARSRLAGGGRGALIVFGLMQVDIKTAVFDALGKDPTLTGRTTYCVGDRAADHGASIR